jgi:hypothetical protein
VDIFNFSDSWNRDKINVVFKGEVIDDILVFFRNKRNIFIELARYTDVLVLFEDVII